MHDRDDDANDGSRFGLTLPARVVFWMRTTEGPMRTVACLILLALAACVESDSRRALDATTADTVSGDMGEVAPDGAGGCAEAGCPLSASPCTENVCQADGRCMEVARAAGFRCDDGDACTLDDACGGGADAGRCLGEAVVCEAAHDCVEAGACNPLSGVCASLARADGSTCEDAPAPDGHGTVSGVCGGGLCRRLPRLALGGFHGCVIRDDDTVRCWGRNEEGQLGLGHTTNVGDGFSGIDVRAAGVVDIGPVQWLTAGTVATCAIGSGELRCWGDGFDGVLGQGDLEDLGGTPGSVPSAIPAVELGPSFVPRAVAIEQQGACAVSDTGRVKCWGTKATGYPGVPEVGLPGAPTIAEMGFVEIGTQLDPFPVDELVRGDNHVCVRSGGDVRCWGYGPLIALGTHAWIGDDEPPSSAAILNESWEASSLAAVGNHTCALTRAGNIYCWGSNDHGQLCAGSTAEVDGVIGAIPFSFELLPTKVVAGGLHSCALFTDGTVRCWGDNHAGALGRGDEVTPIASAADVIPVELGGPAHDIAAGMNFTCAVMRDGAVRCWGSGIYGSLGTDATEHVGDEPEDMPPAAIVFD